MIFGGRSCILENRDDRQKPDKKDGGSIHAVTVPQGKGDADHVGA